MGRFLGLSGLYFGASAFYYLVSDGFWEALRTLVPGFLIGLFYFAMGPVVLLDFAEPVSVFPYVLASLLSLYLLSMWSLSKSNISLAVLGGLWVVAHLGHRIMMGALSGSPPPLS